jgi:hypothetical protein
VLPGELILLLEACVPVAKVEENRDRHATAILDQQLMDNERLARKV